MNPFLIWPGTIGKGLFDCIGHGIWSSEIYRYFIHFKLAITSVIPYVYCMKTLTTTDARKNIYKLVEQANETHEPIQITGKKSNAVLVGEEDWRNIQETLYLTSIPGMRESIIDGMKTPISETSKDLDW